MSYAYMLVNVAKKEFLDPEVLGEPGVALMLLKTHTGVAFSRLIAAPPIGRGSFDGRWASDPVVLAGGMGGDPENLYDRAREEGTFVDISQQVLSELCEDRDIRDEIFEKAAENDTFFLDLCAALTRYRPELLRDREFTSRLGTDWRKRFKEAYGRSLPRVRRRTEI